MMEFRHKSLTTLSFIRPKEMVGDLASRTFSDSYTLSELSHNPISDYFGPSFVEDIQITPVSKSPNPVTSYINKLETPRTDFSKRIELCDSVLNYINSVLMDDDDFENEFCTIKGSKLDATKRSFHEIISGDENDGYTSDDLAETNNETGKNRYVAVDESAIHETLGKIVLLYGKMEELTLNNRYGAFPRKGLNKREAIDTRNLLLQCMEFVASSDHTNANKLIKEIRSKSCPYGNGTERMAHYFTDALQVRLDGNGIPQHTTLAVKSISDNDLLKAFKLYFTEFPFLEAAYYFANQMIINQVDKATNTLHIIHFGIMHGLQWPPLIQQLSKMPGGSPKLRITGIDFPKPGFRPDARVKETGCQLASHCKEFNVPFEYNSIVNNWDNVQLEELKLKKGEVVAVNCMFHMMYLLDDSVMERNPRDTAINLIKSINPDIFVHVIVNGTYNSPFFVSRFREALFYFSTWFDMFDAVLPPESPERMMFESEVWGKQTLNVLASEGLERAERPETYKQWHKRTIRAGFKIMPLDKKIVSDIRTRVKLSYHKDFCLEESGDWLLNGWKGKTMFGMSCWKPT